MMFIPLFQPTLSRPRFKPLIAIVAVTLACAAFGNLPANAQQIAATGFSTASEYLGGTSLVLSANRLIQPVNQAPAAVTIIDRDLIQAMGYKDITDLFRFVPGMTSAHSRGNQHSVGYHGLRDTSSRRLQVLVDGRSVYTPQFSGVEWEDIHVSIDEIERIEVIRSPNAASYGSNAFSATINIITTNPADQFGTHVSLTGGSNGIAEGGLRPHHASGQD